MTDPTLRPEMKVRAIAHVQLGMPPGLEAPARQSYGGILGLEEIAKPANLARRGGEWFKLGALERHLGVEADLRPAKKAHPAFLVEGLEELIERLKQVGRQLASEAPLDGFNRVYVAHAFGNRTELMEGGRAVDPVSLTKGKFHRHTIPGPSMGFLIERKNR